MHVGAYQQEWLLDLFGFVVVVDDFEISVIKDLQNLIIVYFLFKKLNLSIYLDLIISFTDAPKLLTKWFGHGKILNQKFEKIIVGIIFRFFLSIIL